VVVRSVIRFVDVIIQWCRCFWRVCRKWTRTCLWTVSTNWWCYDSV